MDKKEKIYVGLFAFIGFVFGAMYGPLISPQNPLIPSIMTAIISGSVSAVAGRYLLIKFSGKK